MTLLGTGLSWTARFVKSLSLWWLPPSNLRAACVPNSRGQKDARLLPKHLNTSQPTTFIYPSSLASSRRVAVFLSFLSASLRTDILHLTSNSRALSVDGSPRKQPSLPTPPPPNTHAHTIPNVLCDSRWQTPRLKPHTLLAFLPLSVTHTRSMRGSSCGVWQGGVIHGGVEGEPGSTGMSVVNQKPGGGAVILRRVHSVSPCSRLLFSPHA